MELDDASISDDEVVLRRIAEDFVTRRHKRISASRPSSYFPLNPSQQEPHPGRTRRHFRRVRLSSEHLRGRKIGRSADG